MGKDLLGSLELNRVYQMDCIEGMRLIPDNSIDLTVTSPPYDNLRKYKGYSFNFEFVANDLYRITKSGGVVVWVVGDATVEGSETGNSFKQALYFKDIGFNLHDTMIYRKNSYPFPPHNRYYQQFEYMFILSKGTPKTTNLLRVPTKWRKNNEEIATTRNRDGSVSTMKYQKGKETRIKDNVWEIDTGYMRTTRDKFAYEHPAMFPESLANDHILTWSNEGDVVLDPFMGSGTTAKMVQMNGRRYIGFEVSSEYIDLINKRLKSLEEDFSP